MTVSKEDMKKMQDSICPTCDMPMFTESGKKTHSKTKSVICEAKFREKCNVYHEDQFLKVDDKRYLVDANWVKRQPKR